METPITERHARITVDSAYPKLLPDILWQRPITTHHNGFNVDSAHQEPITARHARIWVDYAI
ncbi:hypothetical protein Hamer_G023801 [Homarus americanus]|uniref:Uncharacterized protein n=1 Tax=Homarus americanus TaxID=6706 RepID=A0A8J5MLE2_HOMAM|nr:hypothetical protein Hamer_G023801 [Homarus americanus]